MTRLQAENQRVLDSLIEGQVTAVIRLVQSGIIASDPAKTLRENVFAVLTLPQQERGLGLPYDDVTYFLDFFGL